MGQLQGSGLSMSTPPVPTGDEDARIRSLASMARVLGRPAPAEQLAEAAAEEMLHVLDAASASVSRLESGTGLIRTLVNTGVLGPCEERWPEHEVYQVEDFAGLVRVVCQLSVWRGTLDDPGLEPRERDLLVRLGKGSSMSAPIVVDGAVWGELFGTRCVGVPPFGERDVAYIEALSAILSGALSRAEHVADLEALAYRDPLTGLANRRALELAAVRAIDGLGSSLGPVVLAYLDVNGLKAVNDIFGHGSGDHVLRSVAGLLTGGFGVLHGALVARLGGDEFAVLTCGHDVDRVLTAARDTCRQAPTLPFGVGLACGVAKLGSAGGHDDSPAADAVRLMRAADRAQYRAKRIGGNSVILDDERSAAAGYAATVRAGQALAVGQMLDRAAE